MHKRFGRLTLTDSPPSVSRYPSGRRKTKFECKCDCGKIVFVKKQDLVTGHTESCGCFRREKRQLVKGEAGFRWLYRTYKASAATRKLPFDLTEAQFRILTQATCNYCGVQPSAVAPNDDRHLTEHAKYFYNGIDRADNAIGYLWYNCVTACKQCNIAKRDLSAEDFALWIERVYKFLKGINV